MAEPNNFDLFIGLILAKLYDERGKDINLSCSDFGMAQEPQDFNDDAERINTWDYTVRWLEKEGYLRYETEISDENLENSFISIELTEKGFKALNTIPASLKGKPDEKSTGAKLIELGKKAGWSAARKAGEKGAAEVGSQIADVVQAWLSS